ncbi:ABC transporter substrate-binding protein [Defluviitalea saccharophila]|uniref:ABC transporter substrate-binding protein n=1 Tax=Defluviitalea saccharophila TaxID=879970 RepID=A0ABZ2Y1E4_9FIRM
MKKWMVLYLILIGLLVWGFIGVFNPFFSEFDMKVNNKEKQVSTIHFIHWTPFPEKIFEQFNRKYPDIEIEYEQIDREHYSDLLKSRISSGERIDVMGIMPADYEEFVLTNVLVDLSDQPFLENYHPKVREAIKSMSLQKREYAVVYRDWVYGIWYNKIIFSKYNLDIPKNYEEFLEVCKILKSKDVAPIVLGGRDDYHARLILSIRFFDFLKSHPDWSKNLQYGNVSWNDEELLDVLKDIENFIKEGYLKENSLELTYHQAFLEFVNGQAAMIIMGDWSTNLIQYDIEKVCDPGVFPIPYNKEGEVLEVPGSNGDNLIGIFSGSEKREQAKLFLEYLSSKEAAQVYTDITMTVPPIKGINTDNVKYYELWEPLRKAKRIPVQTNLLDSAKQKSIDRKVKELLMGNITAEELLEQFNKPDD